jgi:catechol 2,3-dioxygenase-like lactoylglutathione lyase family enzyme
MDAGEILGLHHIKVPVTDLARSRAWYQRVFELEPMLEFPDADGVVAGVAYQPKNGFCLSLREHPTLARAMAGFDPFAILVRGQPDVQHWADRLDTLGIQHSPIIQATTGWLLAFHDPDGLELLFYTQARHGLDGAGRGRPVHQAPTAR